MQKTSQLAGTGRILYISYDGLTDPLGQSQILPYILRLSGLGHQFTVLSCEKRSAMDKEGGAIRKLCEAAGVDWRSLPYHKHPTLLASAYDLAMLRHASIRLHRERSFDLVHCRSYFPAAAGLHLKRRFGIPLLFDMRGFWPEEKVEGGIWDLRNPAFRLVYRYFKRLESDLLKEADAIVSLTEAGKAELLKRPELRGEKDRIVVIPCCVDIDHFTVPTAQVRSSARQELGIGRDTSVLAYLGSLGGNYLLDEMLDFFSFYRTRYPGARFLFVTKENSAVIEAAADKRGIGRRELVVRAATREEVPRLLAATDHGIAFKQPSFSATGCSPTKMGEMLATGLPMAANWGVGDVGPLMEEIEAGVAIRDFSREAYASAVDQLGSLQSGDPELRERARPWFDVNLGVMRYDGVYRELLR